MFEKNRMIHPERKRRGPHRHDHAHIDPNAELSSAFINQEISQLEGVSPQPPENANDQKFH